MPDGSYYDVADDTASAPTGQYGDDWIVVSSTDRIGAQFTANAHRNGDAVANGTRVLWEHEARDLFGYRCVTCSKRYVHNEYAWSPEYCSRGCDPDPYGDARSFR